MTHTPLFKTDCPSCGAPVAVHSATAVTVVCPYCRSLLVRHDQSLRDSGRDSALFTDFSPLQIGTTGSIGHLHFTLIGRLQVHYDAGVWNEWYLLFDDGGTGWLSESGDLYVLLRPAPSPDNAPPFENIRAGDSILEYQDKRFVAADVRDITLPRTAAEGELPYEWTNVRTNRVSDWRSEAYFLTLDYETFPPQAFLGYGVALEALALQNTRDDAQIIATAGALKGTRRAESCPNCGSPVEWIAGITPAIICPSCASTLAAEGDKAVLLEAGRLRAQQHKALTLSIGSVATIHGKPYTLIGALYKHELGESSGWTEYLLYNPQQGFLWLVETDDGQWSLSQTLNHWPRLNRALAPQGAQKLYDYRSEVRFAAGAFYWQVRHGDRSIHRDYQDGQYKLGAEIGAQEMSWSKSRDVKPAEIEQWFGISPRTLPKGKEDNRPLSYFMMAFFLMLNIPAWLAIPPDELFNSLVLSGIALYMLYKFGESHPPQGD